METAFPRVTVLDPKKQHHLFIWHSTSRKDARVTCIDCVQEWAFPDSMLPAYLERVRTEGEAQVVAWVQDDGK